MLKFTGLFGILAAALAVADLIHGQNNGDIHRTYIHAPEYVFFLAFLCLGEYLLFRVVSDEFNVNSWLILFFFAILSGFANLLLFALSGGGLHGDGGPIASGFMTLGPISGVCIPIALFGFIVSAITRKNAGSPVLRR